MDQENQFALTQSDSSIPTSETSEERKFTASKLLCLPEVLLPCLWIYAACMGSYGSTLVHICLVLFYAIGVNTVHRMSIKLYTLPTIILIISLLYSIAYFITQTTIYYLPKEQRPKITRVMQYFDFFDSSERVMFKTTYVILQLIIIPFDAIYIASRSYFALTWFCQSRMVCMRNLMIFIRPLFLFTMAVLTASTNSIYLIFMPLVFSLTIISFCLMSCKLPKFVSYCYWVTYVIADLAFVAIKDNSFKNPAHYRWIPRWAVVSCAGVNLLLIGAIIGCNLYTWSFPIRLLKNVYVPWWFLDIIPYVVLATSGLFCILEDSWQSYGVLCFACITSLFGVKFFQSTSRFVLTAMASVYFAQTFFYYYKKQEGFHPKYNFFICILQGVSAVFVHCQKSKNREDHILVNENDKKWVGVAIQWIIVSIFFGNVILNAIFSSKFDFLTYDIPLACILLIMIFQVFNIWAWTILNLITFGSTSIYFIAPLLKKKIVIPWLFDSSVTINPRVMFSKVWPFLILFILTAIQRYYYRPPPQIVIKFSRTIGVFLSLCFSCVYIDNSIFTVLYQLLIVANLFLYRWNYYLIVINTILSASQIVVITTFSYNEIKSIVTHRSFFFKFFGINEHPDITRHQMIPIIILILYIFFGSIARKYNVDENHELMKWMTFLIDNLWTIVLKFSFYLFWSAIFLVVIVSKGVSIVGAVMLIVLGIIKVTGHSAKKPGVFLYVIFMLDVLFVTAVASVNVPPKVTKIVNLIGPLCDTPLAKLANVLVCLCAFLNMSHFDLKTVHPVIIYVGNCLASILISAVEFTLVIMAIQENNILNLFGILVVFIILVHPKISLLEARIITIILNLILGYVLTFIIMKFKGKNDWYDYFLLTNVKMIEIFYIFLTMIVFSLFCEFGRVDVAVGRSFLTTYFPTIVSVATTVISFYAHTYLIFIHTCLLLINQGFNYYNSHFHPKSFTVVIWYAYIILFVKALRPLRFIPQTYSTFDKAFGTIKVDNVNWCVCFWLEFLLRSSLNSPMYQAIHEKELKRAEFRRKRTAIIEEMMEIDQKFADLYFKHTLKILEEGVVNLTVTEDMQTTHSVEDIKKTILEKEQTTQNYKKMISNDGNPDAPPISPAKLLYHSFIGWVLRLLRWFFLWVIDSLIKLGSNFTDINLEPGVHTDFLLKLRDMMTEMVERFSSSNVLTIPQNYIDFSKQLPLSYLNHFQIFHSLNLLSVTEKTRFPLFYHYLKVCSRQAIPALLLVLCFYYPLIERSIFSLSLFFLALICVSFNIESYIPFVITSGFYMFLRCILRSYGMQPLVETFINSLEETHRQLKVSVCFGLNLNLGEKIYLLIVFCLSCASQTYSFTHPFQIRRPKQHPVKEIDPSKMPKLALSEKLMRRINMKSFIKYAFNKIALLIDVIAFVIALFFYMSWTKSSDANSFIHGSSSVTYDFVFFLMGNFVFILLNQWVILSKYKLWLFIYNFLYSLFTFIYMTYLIPVFTDNGCFEHSSYWIYYFMRVLSVIVYSCNLMFGFARMPPSLGNPNPLFTYIKLLTISKVPFLFEFIQLTKWLACTTSLNMFDFMIIGQLRSKLCKQVALLKLFPANSRKKSHILGILFMIAMFCLLFAPFIVMMSSSSTSITNNVQVASVSLGIYGLPELFTGTILPNEDSFMTSSMQKKIMAMNDQRLDPFFANSVRESQYFNYPSITMTNWIISESSARFSMNTIKNTTNPIFIPYVTYKFTVQNPTTKKNIEQITITKNGKQLSEKDLETLYNALNCTVTSSTPHENLSFYLDSLVPVFFIIPLSADATAVPGYTFNVTFSFQKSYSGNYYWSINAMRNDNLPDDIKEGPISSIVFSKPTYDETIGSILSKTGGGFYGMLLFVIMTCGKFIRSFINSFFSDLWIDKMGKPQIFLNVILAIEAHRKEGDLTSEYATAMMLLNTIRSVHNLVRIGGTVPINEVERTNYLL